MACATRSIQRCGGGEHDCRLRGRAALIAFVATFGTTLGLLAAALAWLLNRFLAWCVWEGGRFLERYELMKAIHAEINDTQRGEEHYADVARGREFINRLKQTIPPDAPLVPYVAVDERQLAFDDGLKQIRLLPLDLIEAVVGYYTASGGLARQLADFRSETFRSISRDRQEAVILDTYREGAVVMTLAQTARDWLEAEMSAYRGYAATTAALALAAVVGTAYVIAVPVPRLVSEIDGAVEWARTCDLSVSKRR